MASSPLELYEKAYRFQYVENRIPVAVDLYKRLINEFPDANECGYAVIQLQKIKAQSVAASFSDTAPVPVENKTNPIIVICILLTVGSLLFSGYLHTSLSNETKRRKEHLSTAMNALGKIARNELKEALPLLDELKQIDPEAIAPYELSADIYRKQNKFSEAKNEYTTYFEKNPDKNPGISESVYMSMNKQPEKKPPLAPKPEVKTDRISSSGKASVSTKKRRILPKKGKSKKPPPSSKRTSKKKKSIYLIDPDSVSYF